MITTAAVTVASFIAAVLSGIAAICKIVDTRRHKVKPSRHEYRYAARSAEGGGVTQGLPERAAPTMAGRKSEKVAKYFDVAHLIQTGDGGEFSGHAFHSYLIRIADYSAMSHTWFPFRDANNQLWMIDSREGAGVTKRSLYEEVKKYPGQVYWAQIAPEYRGTFDRKAAADAALDMVLKKTKYGWGGIILQTLIHAPGLRVLAYMLSISTWKVFSKWPFCSAARLIWNRVGGLDSVPGRDPAMTTPQDDYQSMAYCEWVALVP